MTQTILNPVKLPPDSDLTPAEKKFVRDLGNGVPCILPQYSTTPAAPVAGNPNNTIRAEIIRFFAYGGSKKQPVLGSSIWLEGAWIQGMLNLSHASVSFALRFIDCHFDQQVVLSHGEFAGFFLERSHLSKGLEGSGFKTKGTMFWGEGCSVVGEVRMVSARIDENLICDGCTFENSDGVALGFDGASIGGSVLMRRVLVKGQVRLVHARIGGYWDCGGSQFSWSGDKREALKADGVEVNSDVCLRGGFSASGAVVLSGMRIGGNLDCQGGVFKQGMTAENMEVRKSFIWGDVTGNGLVNLISAKVGILAGSMDAWRPFQTMLDGFAYNQFADKSSVESRMHWLGTRPIRAGFLSQPYDQAAYVLFSMGQGNDAWKILLRKELIRIRRQMFDGFSPSPYEQAAKIYSEMGRPVNAWNMLRKKRQLQRKHNKPFWLRWAGGWVIDTLTDFVYRPARTVKWTVGIVLTGTILFGVAGNQGKIVPHQPTILSSSEYQDALDAGMLPMKATRKEFPEYPEFSPLAFSLDVFIPLFALHQESFWAPASGDDDDFWKPSFLLALSFVILAIIIFFVWLPWLLKISASAAMGLGILGISIFINIATVAAHFFFGADSVLWFNDLRWLTVWYWIEILAGWILSSLLALSVTGLLRPRIGGKD